MAFYRYKAKKRERGKIEIAEIIGRIAFGTAIGVVIWVIEVYVKFEMTNRAYRFSNNESEWQWSLDLLISPQYLALPLIIGFITILAPSAITKATPNLNDRKTRNTFLKILFPFRPFESIYLRWHSSRWGRWR